MTHDDSKPFATVPGVEPTTDRGLAAVRVTTESASGLVYLQGAHVAAWQPRDHDPVIYMSENASYAPGKALRGGIPVCFPWFGAHSEQKAYPAHGFARTHDFQYRGARLDSAGNPQLELVLESDAGTLALFPHAFTARLRVTFGPTLELEFSVTNRDAQAFTFEEALHSYFSVADVKQVSVLGLQGATFADKVRDMATFTERDAALHFSAETDRVYESAATCTIVDPVGKRSLVIEKAHSEATVVWNPWAERAAQMSDLGASAWPHMLCVESANVGKSKIALQAGESHLLRVRVSVSA